ncbi:MAG: N-acyl homoserine lactonase family protein [Bacteroidota bacterium]
MKRRRFLKRTSVSLAAAGLGGSLYAAGKMIWYNMPEFVGNPFDDIHTLELGDVEKPIKVHAISTGSLKVKASHRMLKWPAALRFPRILMDSQWTEPLPVHCWVVEHPEGNFLIDTGEQIAFNDPDYFSCDPVTGGINRRIIALQIEKEQEIVGQLAKIDLTPGQIDHVILTHLHIDHVDGLHYFKNAQIWVSDTEYARPYGAVMCKLPSWLSPNQIKYETTNTLSFGSYHATTQSEDLIIVPTPGHTHGHQSVLLRAKDFDIMFAGDVTFSQDQLLNRKLAGIAVDLKKSKASIAQVLEHAQDKPCIYLPSHDPLSAQRLINKEFIYR